MVSVFSNLFPHSCIRFHHLCNPVVHSFIHYLLFYYQLAYCLPGTGLNDELSVWNKTDPVPVLTMSMSTGLQNSKANTEGGTMKTLSVNHPVMPVRNEGHPKMSPQFGLRNLWRTGHLSRCSWGLQHISCSMPSVAILDRCVPS